jgi:plastocyanin
MRTRARYIGCSAAAFVAVAFTAAIAISPASAQAVDAQAQIDSFAFAPQRLIPDATSGKTLRWSARDFS